MDVHEKKREQWFVVLCTFTYIIFEIYCMQISYKLNVVCVPKNTQDKLVILKLFINHLTRVCRLDLDSRTLKMSCVRTKTYGHYSFA